MGGVSRTRVNVFLLVGLLFGQLLMMSWSSKDETGTSALESGMVRATQPVVGLTQVLTGGVHSVAGSVRELRSARSDNVRLRAEVERLRSDLAREREQSLQNERLRRLLGMREDLAPRSVGASVVTAHLSDQTRMIVLDRGTESGIKPDQAVVAWGGAVGRVVFSDKSFAKVRLLTDPNSGVAGVVQRSRAAGMVLGRGASSLEMMYVPKYADVEVGDRVITSGLDGVFPRGFGIGKVTVVSDSAGVTKSIRLDPEVDFASLEEVLALIEPVGGSLLEPPGGGGAP